MAVSILAVSKEYLHGTITASVELDQQIVEVSALPKSSVPTDDTSWTAAAWTGDAGTTRVWELLIGPGTTMALAPGTYSVYVRIHDDPEVPVRRQDTLTVR